MMTETISYTPEEVAHILKITRYTVYEMIKRGDLAAYRIGRKMRIEAPDLENYIHKSKGCSPAAENQLAKTPRPYAPSQGRLILCGQDILLDILARQMEEGMPAASCLRNYIGSIDGLLALYHGTANAVTTHLWDSDTDSYNLPYIRRLLPGHHTVVINLAYRMEGFYVAKGNPKQILTWGDLTAPSLRFVNREPGSGARVLLDEQLRLLDIHHSAIEGYTHEELSHLAVASCVGRKEADVGLGIEKAALQVSGIDFIPLKREQYDLVIRQEDMGTAMMKNLLAILRSQSFHDEISGLGGYDLARTGEIIAEL